MEVKPSMKQQYENGAKQAAAHNAALPAPAKSSKAQAVEH